MSNELTESLQAILGEPHDGANRLRYADLLARSSDAADQARADFIRVQVGLESVDESTPDWGTPFQRARELLSKYRSDWERPLRSLFKPSWMSPAKRLKAHLFGMGGAWGFRRGFVESILAPASTFLDEDAEILGHSPVQSVVLSHASDSLGRLVTDARLDRIAHLYLVGDMELDEDLGRLASNAALTRLTVVEMRIPTLQNYSEELFGTGGSAESVERLLESDEMSEMPAMDGPSVTRLAEITSKVRIRAMFADPQPADEPEMMAIDEFVFVGDLFRRAEVFAVAKGRQDLEVDRGLHRRLVLLKNSRGVDLLKSSSYFYAVLDGTAGS